MREPKHSKPESQNGLRDGPHRTGLRILARIMAREHSRRERPHDSSPGELSVKGEKLDKESGNSSHSCGREMGSDDDNKDVS